MQQDKIPNEKLILVCGLNREGQGESCGDKQGEEVFKELRKIARERGVHPRIRVTQTKCLGYCSEGVNIMITPDNIWLKRITIDDVSAIADQYLNE